MKKTFVSNGDAKGYVGVVCSGSKQKNNNGEWRRRLWILNSKILPTGNVRLAAFCPPRSSCPGTQVLHAHRLVGVLIGTSFLFYGHLFLWLTNLSDPQTTGPHTSNPNQVGGTYAFPLLPPPYLAATYDNNWTMARTKQSARKSTGGKAPHIHLT